jgi:hypothetical protein
MFDLERDLPDEPALGASVRIAHGFGVQMRDLTNGCGGR